MTASITNNITPLAIKDSWVLVQESPSRCFIIWTSDSPPSALIQQHATEIKNSPDLKNQGLFTWQCSPEFGYVVDLKKGWELRDSKQADQLLARVIWEIDRASRS